MSDRCSTSLALVVAAVLAGTGLLAGNGAQGATASPALATPSTGGSTPGTSPFPPGAPTNLVATVTNSGAITLTWTASTPGCCPIEGYDVSYMEAFHDVFWRVPVRNVTTAVMTSGIRAGGQYTLRVAARDSLGQTSRSSNAVTVVTPVVNTGPDTVPPSAPTNLTYTAGPAGTFVLSWSPATDNVGVTGYEVYRFDGAYISSRLGTAPGTTFSVSLPPSPRSQYYVRARDAVGNLSIISNTLVGDPSTPVSPSPSVGPPACRVTYSVTAQWAQGFVATVVIANQGRTPVDGWTLTFAFGGDQQVSSAWNSDFSQSGAQVTMRNAHWNGVIGPGGSTSIGMLGTWAAGHAPPTTLALNGVACEVG